jgi:hypothetical protein
MVKVRELVDARKEEMGESLGQLGARLAEAVERKRPWDHSAVSRFLNEEVTTVPMAEAFSELFGIPRPLFVPHSWDEAVALNATAKRYAGKVTTPEQSRRLAEVDELLAKETQKARLDRDGHAADDDRQHGRSEGGGRSRRTARRRPPPARS